MSTWMYLGLGFLVLVVVMIPVSVASVFRARKQADTTRDDGR